MGEGIQQFERARDLASGELAGLTGLGHRDVFNRLRLSGDGRRTRCNQVEPGIQVEFGQLMHRVAGGIDHLGGGVHGG